MAKVTSAAVPPSAAIASVTAEILTDAANPQLLVHARAEDGTVGVGETWWGTYRPEAVPGSAVRPIASMIDDVLAPMCVGRPSEDIAGLWHELVRSTYQYGH
ncbi:MAG: hypothetical protein ACE5GB_11970, partial [Acidimicrobiales bacterium]